MRVQPEITAGLMDEYGYLFVGRLLLDGQNWPTHTYIFGWDASWYLYGWADKYLNGLIGARLIASVLGLLSLAGFYWFVLEIWHDHRIALIASVLLALDASHRYTSMLATYDIISFTCFVWSLPLLIRACRQTSGQWLIPASMSATLLILATLSKYTVLLYLPLLGVICFVVAPKPAFVGLLIIASVLLSYGFNHYHQLSVLYDIQIAGAHKANSTYTDIVHRIARQAGPIILIALAGLLISVKKGHRKSIQLLLLLSLPMMAYHIIGKNAISLQKHLIFTSAFLLPIAAWWFNLLLLSSFKHANCKGKLFTWFSICIKKGSVALVMLLVFAHGITNTLNLNTMKNSYPDVKDMLPHAQGMTETDSILSEDPYLFRYLLYTKVHQNQISESNWLDNNLDGLFEHSDVKHAIWDEKYEYVFLTDQLHPHLNTELRRMLDLQNYKLLLSKPYSIHSMSGHNRPGTLTLHQRRSLVAENTNMN